MSQQPTGDRTENHLRAVVEQCVRRELAPGAELPPPEEDLIETGAVDSMAWVGVLRCVEAATGFRDFAERMDDRPRSLAAMLEALSLCQQEERKAETGRTTVRGQALQAQFAGWGAAVGARRVTAAELEQEFGLPAGKIASGAGIESVARVGDGEDEVTLGAGAAEAALRQAGADIGGVDAIIATSETFLGFPSLAAALSARLLADADCAALDVGGGCAGLLSGLAVADALLAAGRARQVLLVTADCHSRALRPGAVKGEFGALFGDGASAFVLRAAESGAAASLYRLAEVRLGCTTALASAVQLRLAEEGRLVLRFQGEALARAAVDRLTELLEDLEVRSGTARAAVAGFAFHQPNPRLVDLLARQMGIPAEKIPDVARTCGNLGSSNCGVALARVLEKQAAANAARGPIFVAAIGPGLLWGGTYLY